MTADPTDPHPAWLPPKAFRALGSRRVVVRGAGAVIAVGGEFGTLSEIALALRFGVPVIGLDTWQLVKRGESIDAIAHASSPADAVSLALQGMRPDV